MLHSSLAGKNQSSANTETFVIKIFPSQHPTLTKLHHFNLPKRIIKNCLNYMPKLKRSAKKANNKELDIVKSKMAKHERNEV